MPMPSPTFTGFCGHGDDDDGDAEPGVADLLGHLEAVDLALQEGVDHERVGTQLADLVHDGATVRHGVEQAHLLLVLEEIAHVLRDLGDVLDQQQANLF